MSQELILKTLDNLNIKYTIVTHPPAITAADAKQYLEPDAYICKNLFLTDSKTGKYYLVVFPEHKKAHSNTIRKQVKASRLMFGSEEDLMQLLGVTPGSVSPLGIIYDKEKKITVLLDEDLPKCKKVCFHPNINTSTLTMDYADFEKFLNWSENEYQHVSVTNE